MPTFDVANGSAAAVQGSRGGKPSGLKMPAGLGTLSVEVAPEHGEGAGGGQLSLSSISNAPLSAILGAFGFGSTPGGMLQPASAAGMSFGGFSPQMQLPPLSAFGPSHTPLFGLSPNSVNTFVGSGLSLLEEALDAPLSSRPLTHSRKSPRLFPGDPARW